MDTNLKLWLTSRFDTLEKRLDGMILAMDKMEKRHDVCRTHCDETSGEVFKRLGGLEQHDVRADAEWSTKRSHEERLMRLEEHNTQKHQSLWIKAGALFTGAMVGVVLITFLMAHYWSKQP